MNAKRRRAVNMKQRFIGRNFWLFFCSFTLPTLLMGALLLGLSFRNASREIEARVDNSLGLALDNLELIASEGNTVNYYLENGKQLAYFHSLLGSPEVGYQASVSLRHLTAFVKSLTDSRVYLDSLYIYFPHELDRVFTSEDSVTTLEALPDTGWETEFSGQPDGQSRMRRRAARRREYEPAYEVVSVYKRFSQYRGGVVVNYRLSHLTALLDGIVFPQGQSLFVADERGDILFGNSALPEETARRLLLEDGWEDSGRAVLDGRAYLVRSREYTPVEVRIVTFTPVSAIYASVLVELRNTLLLVLLVAIVTVAMAYYMASKNFRQLSGIIDIFDRAQQGRDLPPVAENKEDLFSYILQNVTRTFVERSYLRVQLSRRKYKLRAAELMALQYQINPHFLFNTLQTINYEVLALTGGGETPANRMLEELSDILRYSLAPPEQGVRLGTEIEHCKKYLFIQSVRHDDRFQIRWEVAESLLDTPVPRLILQPLLENCIDHGFKGKAGPCALRVRIARRGNRIRFRVTDNGLGMPPDRLKVLQERLSAGERDGAQGHIGLSNCSQRLVLHHGPESRIHIRSRAGRGTAVWFEIPAGEAP